MRNTIDTNQKRSLIAEVILQLAAYYAGAILTTAEANRIIKNEKRRLGGADCSGYGSKMVTYFGSSVLEFKPVDARHTQWIKVPYVYQVGEHVTINGRGATIMTADYSGPYYNVSYDGDGGKLNWIGPTTLREFTIPMPEQLSLLESA